MTKGYQAAIEALGEMILNQKNDLAYKDFEIERKNKEVDSLKEELASFKMKLESIEKYISYYEE